MQCIAFGAGTQGQLGNGLLVDCLLPTAVEGIDVRVSSIVCGGNHAVCLAEKTEDFGAQQLFVWGQDHLSNGLTQHAIRDSQVLMTFERNVIQTSGSERAVPFINQSATTSAKSDTEADQTLTTGTTDARVPRQFHLPSPIARVTRVAAGWSHTLLLTDSGQLFVAGDNSYGQLGLGQHIPAANVLVQLQVSNCLQHELLQHSSNESLAASFTADSTSVALHHWCAVDIAAGLRHSLVLLQLNHHSGQQSPQQPMHTSCRSIVAGFGSNKRHQLGITRDAACTSKRAQPAAQHAAVTRVQDGTVWMPCLAEGLSNLGIIRLSAGGDRSAGITRQGRLLLWGRPLPFWGAAGEGNVGHPVAADHGQLTGSCCHTSIPQPQAKAGWLLSSSNVQHNQQLQWVDVKLGWRHMVALDSAGQVWTAGDNSLGQLGTGMMGSHRQLQHSHQHEVGKDSQDVTLQQQQKTQHLQANAVTAQGLIAAVRPQPTLQAEVAHQCHKNLAVASQSLSKLSLVSLPALAIAVAAGAEHCAAALQDGSLYTWGWGEHGQLGTGSTHAKAEPQHVKTAWPAAGVACGSGFTVVWNEKHGAGKADQSAV